MAARHKKNLDEAYAKACKRAEKKGRKVVVQGSVEDVDGDTVYVRSRAVFVEPKYAKLLGSGEVLKALGVPPPAPTPGPVRE